LTDVHRHKSCFLTPPSEPDVPVSEHPALQGLATSRFFSVIGSPFIGAASFTSDIRTSPNDLQLLVVPNVDPLASFPMYAAFPRSEYYDASDAPMLH
jgi:hypothetical protein